MTDLMWDNESNDLYFDGDVDTVEGLDEIEQSLRAAYQTGLGEWTFDTDAGLAVFLIRSRPATDTIIAGEVRRVGERVAGVTEISQIVIRRNDATREMVIDCNAITDLGELELRGITI